MLWSGSLMSYNSQRCHCSNFYRGYLCCCLTTPTVCLHQLRCPIFNLLWLTNISLKRITPLMELSRRSLFVQFSIITSCFFDLFSSFLWCCNSNRNSDILSIMFSITCVASPHIVLWTWSLLWLFEVNGFHYFPIHFPFPSLPPLLTHPPSLVTFLHSLFSPFQYF